jgi:hypothetical protein
LFKRYVSTFRCRNTLLISATSILVATGCEKEKEKETILKISHGQGPWSRAMMKRNPHHFLRCLGHEASCQVDNCPHHLLRPPLIPQEVK